MEQIISKKIAEEVLKAGGRTYYVGGCVRDSILGKNAKDTDIEVHGIAPEKLSSILDDIGGKTEYGKSFGIFSIKGSGLDVAMPRKETAVGRGHKDFIVDIDPFLGEEKAAKRRDFTINALYMDVLTGKILDFFGGEEDLKNGIIRHVSDETFAEDPLRVLRAAQFSARFDFSVAEETKELCRTIDLSGLSKERIFDEMKKALLQGYSPSVFFEFLRDTDRLSFWFPELEKLIGLEQDPQFHPEGDVWVHTMMVLDKAAGYRQNASDPLAFMISALTHDLGKITASKPVNGRIHAYEHERQGLPIAKEFLSRLTTDNSIKSYVLNMTENHMRPNTIYADGSSIKSSNHMFDESIDPKGLIYLALADSLRDDPLKEDSLLRRLSIYKETMAQPFVTGKDLINAGLQPGDVFSDFLSYAHKMRLAGIPKEEALKQTLALAGKYRKQKKNII